MFTVQVCVYFLASLVMLAWFMVNFFPIGRREIVELQAGKTGGKTIVLLAGYALPIESWGWFVKNCLRPQDRVLGFRRRYQENHAWWLWPIGWAPIRWQKREVATMMARLLEQDRKNQKTEVEYLVIGHSFGCTMAFHLVRKFANRIAKCVAIAPPPTARRGFLFNSSFWTAHGFNAVLPSLAGVIRFWNGYEIGPKAFLNLFSSGDLTEQEVEKLVATQVKESPIVFYSHLLFERGLSLRIAAHKGWKGKISYVICEEDKIFKAEYIRKDSYSRPSGELFTLTRAPHCFWLMPTHQYELQNNAKILRHAVYGHDFVTDDEKSTVIQVDFRKK